MTPASQIAHARLASALLHILIAIDAGDVQRAAGAMRRFLNHAIALDNIRLSETAAMAVLLLSELQNEAHSGSKKGSIPVGGRIVS